MSKLSRLLIAGVLVVLLLPFAEACLNSVKSCANKSNCSGNFAQTGFFLEKTTTYCKSCNKCRAGINTCASEDDGCHKCQINNGRTTYTGIACKEVNGKCLHDGGAYACTK